MGFLEIDEGANFVQVRPQVHIEVKLLALLQEALWLGSVLFSHKMWLCWLGRAAVVRLHG